MILDLGENGWTEPIEYKESQIMGADSDQNSNKIITFPPSPDAEDVELPEELSMRLRQASFRLGMPEDQLLEQCLRIYAEYYEEHGHFPLRVVNDLNSERRQH